MKLPYISNIGKIEKKLMLKTFQLGRTVSFTWELTGRILLVLTVCVLVFVQCRSKNNAKGGETGKDTLSENTSYPADSLVVKDSTDASAGKTDSLSNVSFLLPSPDEILGEILTGKIDYNLSLINSKENASRYIDTKHRAMNLGVYLTDLAYLNLNDNKKDALEYFKTIRDLAQKINEYSVFKENLYDRIQKNLTKKDSLNKISKDLYYNMLELLESSRRNNVYALVASGALIEALYLSTATVVKFSDYRAVAQKIFEQKYVIDNFYEFAAQYKKDKDVKSVLDQFDNLKYIIATAGVKNTEKNVTMDKKDHLIIGGGEEILVSEQSFKIFKANVIRIRQEVVSFSK